MIYHLQSSCKRRLFLAGTALITSLTICNTALADGRFYNSEVTVETSHPDWMGWMPDSIKLSELSIPASHDTMAHYGGAARDAAQTQTLRLAEQLDAGIRVLDIRAEQIDDRFQIMHGCYDQFASLQDVVRISGEFLKTHPDETIIMMLGNEGTGEQPRTGIESLTCTSPDVPESTGTYSAAFERVRSGPYGGYIWNPRLPRVDYLGAVSGAGYLGEIPTLGEVRGKIVIIEGLGFVRGCTTGSGCGQKEGNGWKHPSANKHYGIGNTATRLRIYQQPVFKVPTTFDISDQSERVKVFLHKTSDQSEDFISSVCITPPAKGDPGTAACPDGDMLMDGAEALYINQLNGTSGGAYPYTVAGGDGVGTDGVNEAILRYLVSESIPTIERTGIMRMDFPGSALIDAIIAYNFKYRDTNKSITAIASDFKYMVNNIAYDGTEFGGDQQAKTRLDQLKLFFDHTLPDQEMNYFVVIDSISHGGIFDNSGLYMATDWIDTDNIFESREYKAYAFNTNSPQVYTNNELKVFVDQVVDVEGLTNPRDYAVLQAKLYQQFPDSKWSVFVKDGAGGFDNWAYNISIDANFYRKTVGSTDFVVVGTGKVPPPVPPIPLNIELFSTDQYGFASGTIEISPEPWVYYDVNYFLPGTVVELTATPAIDSEFASWGGSASVASCNTSICEVTVSEGLEIQVTYKPKPLLQLDSLGDGAITRSLIGNGCVESANNTCLRYSTGDEIELTAAPTPDKFSQFSHWEGDCLAGGVSSVTSITMNGDKSCAAVFSRTAYHLTVSSLNTSVASETIGEINCGIDCTETYLVSNGPKTVILNASVDPDSVFVRWYGDTDCYDEDENDGDPKRISITVGNVDVSCSAVSVLSGTEYALTVEKIGAGVGKVTAEATPALDSSDIDCAFSACSMTYPVNSVIQLTAKPGRGSLFAGWNGDSDCIDGQVTMTSNVTCSARFTADLLLIDGSNFFGSLRTEFESMLVNTPVGGDYDYWSVQSPTSSGTVNSTDPNTFEKRVEPVATDLATYSRVIWYTGNTSSSPVAGPGPAAEAALSEYLDNGGCYLLSSSEYFAERGITPFTETYLGVSAITNNVGDGVTHTLLNGTGLNKDFNSIGSFRLTGDSGMDISLSDSMVASSVPDNDVLFRYADGGDAAVTLDNGTYRTAFFGFPFLGLKSGNDRNNVMGAFLNFCGSKELDDVFENNNSFDEASRKQGIVSLKELKILSGNDDYFRWVSNWDLDTMFSILFSHASGDLAMEVYDSTHTLIASAQSADDNEEIVITNVEPGQIYFVRVFGVNNSTNRYALNITNAVPFEVIDTTSFLVVPLDVVETLVEPPVVVDPPVIIPPDSITVATFDATGVAATDSDIVAFLGAVTIGAHVEGLVTITHDAESQFALGSNIVTFSATDSDGNTGSVTATVAVTDQSAPVISLIGNNSMTLNIGDSFTDAGATVIDNVDADRTISGVGSVDTSSVGIYTLSYSVSDAAGNAALSVTRSISVQDNADDNDTSDGGGGGAINIWMLFILFSFNFIYVASPRARLKIKVK